MVPTTQADVLAVPDTAPNANAAAPPVVVNKPIATAAAAMHAVAIAA